MDEERLVELLRALPPAPQSWVQAAQGVGAEALDTMAPVTDDHGWEPASDDSAAWPHDGWLGDDDDPGSEPLEGTES